MFRLEVDLDDLTLEGLNAVLSVLFDDLKGSFTTDWALAGPLIEALGVTLSYTPPAQDPGDRVVLHTRAGEEPEEEACWMADYDGQYESHAKPLVAVARALIRSKMPGETLFLPAEATIKYLKRESTAVDCILQESDFHEVKQFGDDINTYSLTPKPGCLEEFQPLVAVVRQLSRLHIIDERAGSELPGSVDLIVVKHS
jgi:hypothetical protein